jgi:hypothetical protein
MTKSFLIFRRIYIFLGTILLRTVHNNFSSLFFGIPFTRPNPDFVQSVKSQLSPASKLLIVCQEGSRLVYHFLPYLALKKKYSKFSSCMEFLFLSLNFVSCKLYRM